MDHVGVLLVGLDGFELLLQFDGDHSIRCDAKSMFEKGYKIHSMPPGYTEDRVKADLGYIKFPHE